MKNILIPLLLLSFAVSAQPYKVDTLLNSGPVSNHITLVMMGDGFTTAQQPTLSARAAQAVSYLFTVPPFQQYEPTFNVIVIHTNSTDTGIAHPRTAADCPPISVQPISKPNTFFSSSFDGLDTHRYVDVGNKTLMASVVKSVIPSYNGAQTPNIIPVMVCNTRYYGGGEYGTSVTFTLDTASNKIFVHELGHAIGGLVDEYLYTTEGWNCQSAFDPPSFIKWLLVPGTGRFTTVGGGVTPTPNCCMRTLGQPFCPQCTQRLIYAFNALANPIKSFLPAGATTLSAGSTVTFSITISKDIPNTQAALWYLDNQPVGNGFSYSLQNDLTTPGAHTLTAIVQDGITAQTQMPTYAQSWQVTTVQKVNTVNLNIYPQFTIPPTQLIPPNVNISPNPDNYRCLFTWPLILVPAGYTANYYEFQYSTDGINFSTWTTTQQEPFTITHLVTKTKYWFRMRVDYYNGVSMTDSNWSPAQTVTTL